MCINEYIGWRYSEMGYNGWRYNGRRYKQPCGKPVENYTMPCGKLIPHIMHGCVVFTFQKRHFRPKSATRSNYISHPSNPSPHHILTTIYPDPPNKNCIRRGLPATKLGRSFTFIGCPFNWHPVFNTGQSWLRSWTVTLDCNISCNYFKISSGLLRNMQEYFRNVLCIVRYYVKL